MTDNKIREAFEEQIITLGAIKGLTPDLYLDERGCYENICVEYAWIGFQAGYSANRGEVSKLTAAGDRMANFIKNLHQLNLADDEQASGTSAFLAYDAEHASQIETRLKGLTKFPNAISNYKASNFRARQALTEEE